MTCCDDGCGAIVEVTLEDSDDASGYRGEVHLCRACLDKRMERLR